MSGGKQEKQPNRDEKPNTLPRLILHDDNSLLQLLHLFQRLFKQNPAAARAMIQAFVAEGHRFANTPEGLRWKDTLSGSVLVQHGRLIWQACNLDSLLDNEPALLPSDWLDYLISGMTEVDIEIVLSQLIMEGAWHGTFRNS